MKDKNRYVVDIIRKLSDVQFQKKNWLEEKNFDYVSGFVEAVNLLEDYDFFDDFDNELIPLDSDQQQTVANFTNQLLKFDYEKFKSLEEMLDDKDWIEFTMSARKVFQILNNKTW